MQSIENVVLNIQVCYHVLDFEVSSRDGPLLFAVQVFTLTSEHFSF